MTVRLADRGAVPGLVGESVALRATAIEAARIVAGPLLAAFRSGVMAQEAKRDLHDVVTAHDRAAEEAIVSVILDQVPDSTIVGEEGGRRGDGAVEWHVDPVDGTSNFARGLAHWCVSIAAVRDDRVVAGVVLDPTRDHLFSADLTGAWLGPVPLLSRAASTEGAATLISSFPNARDLARFGDRVVLAQVPLVHSFRTTRNLGSTALSLAQVAAGWADATMGFATSSWDVAAGSFILDQAGGTFHGLRHGRPCTLGHTAPDFWAVGAAVPGSPDPSYPTLVEFVTNCSRRHVRA